MNSYFHLMCLCVNVHVCVEVCMSHCVHGGLLVDIASGIKLH